MRVEAIIFTICAGFFLLVGPFYWFVSDDPAGNKDPAGATALIMSGLLSGLIAFFMWVHTKRYSEAGIERPEDRKEALISDGAGELDFFPPYSWWPLWCGLALATFTTGIVIGWWLAIIGGVFGLVALAGWVFEYYRGVHAH